MKRAVEGTVSGDSEDPNKIIEERKYLILLFMIRRTDESVMFGKSIVRCPDINAA